MKTYIEMMNEVREKQLAYQLWRIRDGVERLKETLIFAGVGLVRRVANGIAEGKCRIYGHEWTRMKFTRYNGSERVWVVCARCGRREEA